MIERPQTKFTCSCYKCGTKGHWAQICKTNDHLVKLYRDSLRKEKYIAEANLIEDTPPDSSEMYISDFLADPIESTTSNNLVSLYPVETNFIGDTPLNSFESFLVYHLLTLLLTYTLKTSLRP